MPAGTQFCLLQQAPGYKDAWCSVCTKLAIARLLGSTLDAPAYLILYAALTSIQTAAAPLPQDLIRKLGGADSSITGVIDGLPSRVRGIVGKRGNHSVTAPFTNLRRSIKQSRSLIDSVTNTLGLGSVWETITAVRTTASSNIKGTVGGVISGSCLTKRSAVGVTDELTGQLVDIFDKVDGMVPRAVTAQVTGLISGTKQSSGFGHCLVDGVTWLWDTITGLWYSNPTGKDSSIIGVNGVCPHVKRSTAGVPDGLISQLVDIFASNQGASLAIGSADWAGSGGYVKCVYRIFL
ncbi:hypothetical protein H0H81_002214 [Sphagnurus paluster]|uniref:Uncharacterized protein n=1 Tax=Sphagnurus paluster TaxID=117069 RepID=A0A9P7FP70_9AGAR|nr:hypothetical protein H0H81_002214 [Sphagnurus paluster]